MYLLGLLAQHSGTADTKWPADSVMFLPSSPLKMKVATPGALNIIWFRSHWSLFNMQISVLHTQDFQPYGLFENPWRFLCGWSEQLLEKPLSKGQEGGQVLGYTEGSLGLVGSSFGNYSCGCGGPRFPHLQNASINMLYLCSVTGEWNLLTKSNSWTLRPRQGSWRISRRYVCG